jgi:hypothetical protein
MADNTRDSGPRQDAAIEPLTSNMRGVRLEQGQGGRGGEEEGTAGGLQDSRVTNSQTTTDVKLDI